MFYHWVLWQWMASEFACYWDFPIFQYLIKNPAFRRISGF